MIRILFCILLIAVPTAAEEETLEFDFDNQPTYIKSNQLTLYSKERRFVYTGEVEMTQGEMVLTSKKLEGFYDKNNEIQSLVATGNVVITKGEHLRGTGGRATYKKKTETIELTENPELQKKNSVLTADLITIFVQEDRSTAKGSVRVKVVDDKKESGDKKKKKKKL